MEYQSIWKCLKKLFDIKPIKDGLEWYTLQEKNVAENFIVKLPQSIHRWKSGFVPSISQWNRRRTLPNYEVYPRFQYIEDYKNILVRYSFRMRLRKICWDENLLKVAGLYAAYEPNLEEII